MKHPILDQYFQIHRRYYRSVNLERDLYNADAVTGYILTERSAATLGRILPALTRLDTHRVWTLTGVYGTGKSAFAHYLASLCAAKCHPVHQEAVKIARSFLPAEEEGLKAIAKLPEQGLVIAVATGQQEPLAWTLARALAEGAEKFLPNKERGSKFLMQLNDWKFEAEEGTCRVKPQEIVLAIKELSQAAQTHILLIVDELGKNLEFAARHHGKEDLYLLQQIAELRLPGEHQVYFVGLLHQSFGGYSDRLSVTEQNEWNKIQGRFEDIPCTESPNQMTRLIGQIIDHSAADPILSKINSAAAQWSAVLGQAIAEQDITEQLIADTYPLHPLTALVLPILCTRYAQNDRSLFTFLTSDEPHSFKRFLEETTSKDGFIPTLQLYRLYDYFVETVTGLASRLNLQRWVEIRGLIDDVGDRSPETLKLLKTIGVLNLVTATGTLKATSDLVAWALCDLPDVAQKKAKLKAIQDLQEKGLITHRKRPDEWRIWEGSDFDIEQAIADGIERERTSLTQLLSEISPLTPMVAQRHYNQTGTLRYFEQRYSDSMTEWGKLCCSDGSYDGLILHWLDVALPKDLPPKTAEGKPLIVIRVSHLETLQVRGRELQALKTIHKKAPELQNDGVARREVRHRLIEAERLLDEAIAQSFSWSVGENDCWIGGESVAIHRVRDFQSQLSDLCDLIYPQGIVLDNELINRRELTSQGMKARRELIEAIIERGDQPRLGLEGYGPEVAMYTSVLQSSQIHREKEGQWQFLPPHKSSGLLTLWQAIEDFCTEATETARSLDELYRKLEQAPYGIKKGIIPVLLATVLLNHCDDIGIYQDGTYIPVLGIEHFELLVRYPERFAVKSFAIAGLRFQVFKELENILKSPILKTANFTRNSTLLTVVTPLYQFVKRLPRYTKQTRQISPEAQKVLEVLQKTVEPDELLFFSLPEAFGLEPIQADLQETQENIAHELTIRMVETLREIHGAYDALLTKMKFLVYKAFGIHREETRLREDLRVRSSYLIDCCIEPTLKRFMLAASDEIADERTWLEALLMIISDKPVQSWTDVDETQFEVNLADLSRRFRNLEALQREVAVKGEGFEARRITITRPDGQESHSVVWVDRHRKEQAEKFLDEALKQLGTEDRQLQQALLIQLTEKLIGVDSSKNILDLDKKKESKATKDPGRYKKQG